MKDLDLRLQLTDDLKQTWFYNSVKHALKINKHAVIFDDSFTFKVIKDTDEFIEVHFIIDNKEDESTLVEVYSNTEKYFSKPTNILEDILLYINNYI